jgi:hypothetical protein
MDITINLNGIQEGKRYVLEFSLNGEHVEVTQKSTPKKRTTKKENDDMPSLEDIEKGNEEFKIPEIEPPKKSKKDYKIERSWDDNGIDNA